MEYNELGFLDQLQHKHLDIFSPSSLHPFLFPFALFSLSPPPTLFAPDAQGIIRLVT